MNRHYDYNLSINTWGGPLKYSGMQSKNVTKKTALTYLLDKLNMDQKDLIAFGDEAQRYRHAGSRWSLNAP